MKRDQTEREVSGSPPMIVERVQTGVRMEKRLLQVLKEHAERRGESPGELLEYIVIHAYQDPHEPPFYPDELRRIAAMKAKHGVDYDIYDTPRLTSSGDRYEGREMTDEMWARVHRLAGQTLETATGKPFAVLTVTDRSVTLKPLHGTGTYSISRAKFNAVLKLGLQPDQMTAQRLFDEHVSLPVYKIAILREVMR